MATVIKSMNDLEKVLELKIQQALKMTQDEIWDAVKFEIEKYYSEYTPEIYERTYAFARSLIKTQIIKKGNALSCTVEIDPNYLKYTYEGNPFQPRISHFNPATGYDVVNWANNNSHGGVYGDSFGRFWNDAMEYLGLKPGITYIMKKNLKKCGVPVK